MADPMSLGLQIILIILAIVWLAIWITTLINQAKKKKFWWLGITALIQITLVIYWIVFISSPKFRKKYE